MRVALLCFGSRGDVQPMVVLADELARRGHEPVLGVSPNLVEFARRAGFPAEPVGVDVQEYLDSPEGQRLLAAGTVRPLVKRMSELLHDFAPQADAQIQKVCDGVDLIVSQVLCEDSALSVAEAYGIPFVGLHLTPMHPTRGFANPMVTTRQLPPALNRATGHLFWRMWWRERRADANRLRGELGLPPANSPSLARMAATGSPAIQAYSRRIVADWKDHGPNVSFGGYLTPSAQLRPRVGDAGVAKDLSGWLDAAEPPVYFGFGSMPVADPAAALAMIREVAERRGLRAIVGAGWSRFDQDLDGDRKTGAP